MGDGFALHFGYELGGGEQGAACFFGLGVEVAEGGHVEAVRPGVALRGGELPGVAALFEVAEEAVELAGEAALLHYEVLAHAGDLGHVLDEHGARLHAGPAGGARP
ncbi:MAG TPA: hypothetical protein VND68_12520 [Chloroflexia bacterium]|nr:hypothetical protein [Chloroflexia bacterium]